MDFLKAFGCNMFQPCQGKDSWSTSCLMCPVTLRHMRMENTKETLCSVLFFLILSSYRENGFFKNNIPNPLAKLGI